jgi:hypothetical protein
MTQKNHRHRGQSLVEVALLLPILLILLSGLIDFGRVYYAMVALNDSAEEGATYASLWPSDYEETQRRTAAASSGVVTFPPESVSVIYPPGYPDVSVGTPITVTVNYTLSLYTPLANTMFPNGVLEVQGKAVQPLMTNP